MKKILSYLKTNCYDEKFSNNKKKYIFQCFLATMVAYLVLTALSIISNVIVIASIASTSFIIFAAPHSEQSKARYLIGGYCVGLSVGILCYYLMIFCMKLFPILHVHFDEIFGALAVGISFFLMVIFDFEHAPASSASLALVLNEWDFLTLGITLFAVILLTVARKLLADRLIQLI